MVEKIVNSYIKEHGYIALSNGNGDDTKNLKIFDNPIVGYASIEDKIFDEFKENYNIMYNRFKKPQEWLDNGKTVISIFFPYSQNIKDSNSKDMKYPSEEWLYARYEGQQIIDECTRYLSDCLKLKGYNAKAPSIDKDFKAMIGTWIDTDEELTNSHYNSNWSERHIAFACGLGTFGLSKGIITKKGMAGRFSSIITNYYHEPTCREYAGIYDYCNMCGKCIKNCPVKAISVENGKEHTPCSKFLDTIKIKSNPRYGCGKCQVSVPCQSKIPK